MLFGCLGISEKQIFLITIRFPLIMEEIKLGLEGIIALSAVVVAAGGVAVFASLYFHELKRRDGFKNSLQASLAASKKGYNSSDEILGNIGPLIRAYERNEDPGYQTEEGKLLNLDPLKTIPLNYHWSWGLGSTLKVGLQSHIVEQGVKVGADAYFLSHMVSGHGNPMYALTFFKTRKNYDRR